MVRASWLVTQIDSMHVDVVSARGSSRNSSEVRTYLLAPDCRRYHSAIIPRASAAAAPRDTRRRARAGESHGATAWRVRFIAGGSPARSS
eukprot:16436444-Heterocapsa_arctica.AAC.1